MKDELASVREALEKARKINRSILSGGPSDTAALNTITLLNEALSSLSKIEEGIMWIPANTPDAMPPEGRQLMTYTPDDDQKRRYRIITFGSVGGGFPSEVTHFKFLPTPPDTHQP